MTKTLPLSNLETKPVDSHQLPRVAIIGAGLTGLITAHLLEQAFAKNSRAIDIVIFEKSAGVGRLATRYKKSDPNSSHQWQFDFGAQFFTAKSRAFQAYLQPWLQQQVIEPWLAQTAIACSNKLQPELDLDIELSEQWRTEQPRYVSSPKMTSFGRNIVKLLQSTELNYKTRVTALTEANVNLNDHPTLNIDNDLTEKKPKTSLFDTDDNHLGLFDWLICTAPQAQAIDLLQQTSFTALEAIKQPKMLACYTLMLGWEKLSDMPYIIREANWSVLEVKDANSPIYRVFIEHHKPGREAILPSVTIYASNVWSEANVDKDLPKVQQQLLQAAQSLLDWDNVSAPKLIDCHRWRYAATQQTVNLAQNIDSNKIIHIDYDKQWIVTGDWCAEGRIESCFEAATEVVKILVI
ncbi:NAD(P)-binding protein [Psychrobacter sp.]|uniref:NAD(P)/FAD-dependent oxidoreductase n=1 Tax=Psychrobacter sp. TaxID=56811 RepID=UPI0025D4E262|nr:NAD(P)-binding protein [Psychrobacter sp.]